MRIDRLRLMNFRQHEHTEIEFGAGLTGIIGPNGAGKTTLLEAIAWAMYGMPAARGNRETLRRRNAPPRARVEVEVDFTLGPVAGHSDGAASRDYREPPACRTSPRQWPRGA